MKRENTKGLREGAIAVALTAVLALLTRYMPLFSMLGTFVCGIPIAILAARNNLRVVWPALLASFAVTVLISGSVISAASLVLMSCVPGGIAGYMMGKKKPFFMTLFSTCLAVCIGWIFELVILETVIGSGIDEILAETMSQTKAMMSGIINSMGEGANNEAAVSPQQLLDTLILTTESLIKIYFPSFIVISSMITGYIIIRVSGFVIKRTNLASVETVPFSHLKAPRSMSAVAIIFYIIYVFTDNKSAVFPIFANIIFILYTMLGVCGLSFVDFKFKTKIKSAVARFAIYVLIFLFGGIFVSIISTVLIFIGIMDAGRDFRQIES